MGNSNKTKAIQSAGTKPQTTAGPVAVQAKLPVAAVEQVAEDGVCVCDDRPEDECSCSLNQPIPAWRRYKIRNINLGEGAFAKVRLGLDTKTGERIAIKIVDTRNHTMPHWKIIREMRVMERLDHHNVVKMHEWLDQGENIYVVLEFIEGCDLLSYVSRKKRLSEARAREIFLQVLDGVEHCHERGVAHRDLKLENVMLDQRGKSAKIIDFGLADVLPEDDRRFEEYCGSPAYCCPQIASGEPYDGRKADIWSLGVMLYIMLTGAYPFWHNSKEILLGQIKTRDMNLDVRLQAVSPLVRDLVLKMLEKKEASRLSLDDVRAHPWLAGAAQPCSR